MRECDDRRPFPVSMRLLPPPSRVGSFLTTRLIRLGWVSFALLSAVGCAQTRAGFGCCHHAPRIPCHLGLGDEAATECCALRSRPQKDASSAARGILGDVRRKFADNRSHTASSQVTKARSPLGNVYAHLLPADLLTADVGNEPAEVLVQTSDFVEETDQLTPAGCERILEIATQMRSRPMPVVIERTGHDHDAELDVMRRDLVAQILEDLGSPEAQSQTILGPGLTSPPNNEAMNLAWHDQGASSSGVRRLFGSFSRWDERTRSTLGP